MKRILIYLMLLSTLSSGLAFAWDIHPEAIVGHDSVASDMLSALDHDDSDDNLNHNDGDHCCHATAHMLAIVFQHISPVTPKTNDLFVTHSYTSASNYIAPLLRPPIS